MASDPILEKFENLNVWTRADERAPHKPLLILLVLAEFSRGRYSLPFVDCEHKLAELLREFGPSRSSHHPEYPFWRLQNDGLWLVSSDTPLTFRQSNADIPRTRLRAGHATGAFIDEVRARLVQDPSLLANIAQRLLSAHFPTSIHQDILDSVGLSIDPLIATLRQRDPDFRRRVMTAYEYRCTFCGLDIRLANMTIGLEAAHIQWHQAGGPDIESNGLALCSIHHKFFDLGAITIDTDLRLLVSEHATGTHQFNEALLRHHGRIVRQPSSPEHVPSHKYLAWHRHEVFKEKPRHLQMSSAPDA